MLNENYKVAFSTKKAHKIEIDGVEFWISNKWIKEDGLLSQEAIKAYERAKTIDMAVRKKAKTLSRIENVDVEALLEELNEKKADISSVLFVWLNELTSLLNVLYSHQMMRDNANKIYAIDVWRRIAKILKNKLT